MLPTDVKLKPHTKQATVLIFLIMLIIDTTSSYSNACFGPITKENIIAKGIGGSLSVYKRSVLLACNVSEYNPLYIISALGGGFYIYDNNSNKFICWKGQNVIGMNFREINRRNNWEMCKFQDYVHSRKDAYIFLSRFGHREPRLKIHLKKLKRRGCKTKISMVDEFLKFPADRCDCEKAYELFCRTRLKRMKELSIVCKTDPKTICNKRNPFGI